MCQIRVRPGCVQDWWVLTPEMRIMIQLYGVIHIMTEILILRIQLYLMIVVNHTY